MTEADKTSLLEQLERFFLSETEVDPQLRRANVVEGLYAISNGLHAIAKAVNRLADLKEAEMITGGGKAD